MDPQEIRYQSIAFQQSRIFITAFDHEIFTRLDDGKISLVSNIDECRFIISL